MTAEIGYGSSNQPGLPPVSLPSAGPPPEIVRKPLKLTVTPQKDGFWDSLPNDTDNAPPLPSGDNTQVAKGSNFWDSLPNAPLPPAKPPTLAEDMGQTLAKNTLPMTAVGRVNWPADLANLAYHGGQYIGNKLRDKPLEGDEYDQMMSHSPLFGSGDIVQGAEQAMGIQPYDPRYPATKFANTMATMALGRSPVGMPSMSLPQALTVGAGAGGAQYAAPNSQAAPLIGGAIAALAHAPAAAGMAKAKTSLNNMGIGEKVMSLSPDVSATQGQVNQATRNISNAATNPQNLLNSVNGKSEMVNGSQPTMAEMSPDQGIAQYQDATRTQNPTPFQKRVQDQNTARAQSLVNIKGDGNAQSIGQFFVQKLQTADEFATAAEKKAQEHAMQRGASIGKYGEMPKEGAASDVVQNEQAVRKEGESAAWKFLDTYGKSPADRGPVIEAAKNLKNNINELGGEEHALVETRLYDKIEKDWPSGNINVDTLKTLRTSIGDAQREVKAGTQAYRRLSILKNSVDKAIENTVNGIIEHENQAVEAGRMSEEATLETGLAQDRQGFYNRKYAKQQTATGEHSGTSSRGHADGRPASISGRTRAEEHPDRGHRNAQGSESLPPAFGKEQKQQYEAARSVTFKNKTLTDLENSGVIKPDGAIDPAKYDRWYLKNRDRLKSDKEFRDQLKDWKEAQQQVNEVRAAREAEQKALQKSRIAKFVDDRDPVAEIGKIFGNKSTSRKEFANLVNKVKGDHEALQGLKAAVGEHILKTFKVELDDVVGESGKTEKVGRIGQQASLRFFIKNNKEALREIYGSGQELQDLEAVANDIKRSQSMYERAKIKGQSNTTKDALQVAKQKKPSVLGKILEYGPVVGGALGSLFGHVGAGAGTGYALEKIAKLHDAFQSKGLSTIKAIELEMLMHPSTFGRAMLQQIEAAEIPIPVQKRIASTLLNSAPQQGIIASEHKRTNAMRK